MAINSRIPKCIRSLSFNLTRLSTIFWCHIWSTSPKIFAQHLLTLSTSKKRIAQSYCDQNPTLIFQIFLIDFPNFDELKILKIQLTLSAIKCRASRAFFFFALTLYKTFARQTFASLRLFTCLVYVSTYCLPIALCVKTSRFDYSIWATPK